MIHADMLDILFEDEALIFINKPAGVVVQQRMHHPGEPYLHADVTRHTSPAYLMQRLDRGTSGVMFFSKRGDLNARLTHQFQRKRIRKRYLALCDGYLAAPRTIDAPLARVGPITFAVREGGKTAITHVLPLHPTPGGSLLEIGLETGRTHQIRVHLSSIGHPLAGDWLIWTTRRPAPDAARRRDRDDAPVDECAASRGVTASGRLPRGGRPPRDLRHEVLVLGRAGARMLGVSSRRPPTTSRGRMSTYGRRVQDVEPVVA